MITVIKSRREVRKSEIAGMLPKLAMPFETEEVKETAAAFFHVATLLSYSNQSIQITFAWKLCWKSLKSST